RGRSNTGRWWPRSKAWKRQRTARRQRYACANVTCVKYVALLRGINVGGKNLLPMKELAAMFERAGCSEVRTYIQSGNVVFAASASVVKTLAEKIGAQIEKQFGFRAPVVLRSADELRAAIRDNPYVKKVDDHK